MASTSSHQMPSSQLRQLTKKEPCATSLNFPAKHGRDVSLGMANGVHGSGLVKFGETRTAQVIASILPQKMSGLTKSGFKNVIRKIKPQSKNLADNIRQPVYQVIMVATSDETDDIMGNFPELQATRSNAYSADLITKGNSKLKGILGGGGKTISNLNFKYIIKFLFTTPIPNNTYFNKLTKKPHFIH